jgi:uncharacterized protein YbaA (DUF1428 family)
MNKYIDGFVLPLPKNQLEAFRAVAEKACAIWLEHGALDYVEAVADDMDAKDMVAFPQLAGCSTDEVPVFSYIVYRSREHRDEVNAKVMADPRLVEDVCLGVFDYKRMAYGGFKSIVSVAVQKI